MPFLIWIFLRSTSRCGVGGSPRRGVQRQSHYLSTMPQILRNEAPRRLHPRAEATGGKSKAARERVWEPHSK